LYVALDQMLSNPDRLREYSLRAQKVAAKYSFESVRTVWQEFLKSENLWWPIQ
jgi:hypothetical protein